jgi:hypothetical protein
MSCATNKPPSCERQITDDPTVNHRLDMNHNYSPDGKWLVYDTRIDQLTTTRAIEKVNVETGEIVTLRRAESVDPTMGTGLGAASYLPGSDEAIFIHGLNNGFEYGFSRRLGAIVPGDGSAADDPSKVRWADARDVTPPFTPGALRGGTHRHDPGGPNGRWIGFTYNDQIMAAQGPDLRAIGVTKLDHPVSVDENIENRSGEGFSAIVVSVKDPDDLDTRAESEDIYRATDDQWIGTRGYQKPDGSWQIARAFIGHMKVADEDGTIRDHQEVFVVEIPEDITRPGPNGPLEGTESQYPAPPAGTVQRRLTYSDGCGNLVRSTPDGSLLAFKSLADDGSMQIFVMSPHSAAERTELDNETRRAGEYRQVTRFPDSVRAPPRWLADGKHFVTVTSDKMVIVNVESGNWRRLAECYVGTSAGLVISPDGSTVAFNRMIPVNDGSEETRMQIFVADVVLPD